MIQTTQSDQVVSDIDTYIRSAGRPYSAWYIGIACDPRDRLFRAHNVAEGAGHWIYRDASTATAARAIEKMFLNAGCKGGPCGGDHNTTFVYAYLITPTTCE